MKKIISFCLGLSTILASLVIVLPAQAIESHWNVTGSYVVSMEYLGTGYTHEMTLTQDGVGGISGNGGSPAGAPTYLWTIETGSVVGNILTLSAKYTAPADTVTPQTVITINGSIASDGTLSGTWSDNYAGGTRSGSWTTTSGTATKVVSTPTLTAEDFGVVSFDTGLGILSGYTAGFGLTNATFADVQSVVVELFAGTTLLQSNTATAKVGTDITGTQISSPFDISGTFPYVTDGYWVNVRAAQYGQSVPATSVVATVTLKDGTIVTATNTNRTGDPTSIYPTQSSSTVTVTIEKFIQGSLATAATAQNVDFPMVSTWDATNIGAGSGSYVLSETNALPYRAITTAMTKGADYATHEVLTTPDVAAQCTSDTPFALQGYTVGNTRAEALTATPTTTSPTFTNLQNDAFVIVWNRDCALPEGEIGGEVRDPQGSLVVTSIDMIDTIATANGSFTDGWKYVFHITAPSNEPNLAMRFSDWLKSDGITFAAGGNMRISSAQADNSGARILINTANVYSVPSLHMTGDNNPALVGRQVEITVEVAIPTSTPSGSYTTTYGVRSNPS